MWSERLVFDQQRGSLGLGKRELFSLPGMNKRASIICACLVGLGLTVVLLLKGDERTSSPVQAVARSEGSDASTRPSPDMATPSIRSPAKPVTVEAADSESQSRRDFLSDYWGERWPEIEKAMLKARVDLDAGMEIVPWEEAAPQLAVLAQLDESEWKAAANHLSGWWSDTWEVPFEKWVKDNFRVPGEVGEDEMRGLEDACHPFNEQLAVLGETYAAQIDSYLRERWATGSIVKAPFSTYGVSNETGFYSTSSAAAGWSIVITLKLEDCPDIAQTLREAEVLKDQRAEAGKRYLLSPRR